MSLTDDRPEAARAEGAHRVPQRSVLADEVYEIIREDLVSGRIEPGARINLDQLARELHVSNTPVRQALARLGADGLVTKEPYRSFTASPLLDSQAIAQLYDYRLILEPTLAARAARRRSAQGVRELEQLCDPRRISQLVDDPAAANLLGERDVEFHCTVAAEAGNLLIVENIRSTTARMSRFTLYPRHGGEGESAWAEHRAIASAIAAGDPDAAAAAMRSHLTNALDRLGAAVS